MTYFSSLNTPPSKIVIQTRKGGSIDNHIPPKPITTQQLDKAILDLKKLWVVRCSPDFDRQYNCAGHVWAARRAHIATDWTNISKILTDDGYRKVRQEDVLRGDIVLYIDHADTPTPELAHVAVVFDVTKLDLGYVESNSKDIKVLSKMGLTVGEVFHGFKDIPSDLEHSRVEFWTDRPV